MPDFAPNFTGRVKLRYSALGREHSMLWRFPSTGTVVSAGETITHMQNFLNIIEGNLYADFTILGADYALANSDVFLPISPPVGIVGLEVVPAFPQSQSASAISWVGRSAKGARHRFFLYGMSLNLEGVGIEERSDDFRYFSTEIGVVASGYVALAGGPGTLVANDDSAVSWYNYVNVKYNDYWVRQVRG